MLESLFEQFLIRVAGEGQGADCVQWVENSGASVLLTPAPKTRFFSTVGQCLQEEASMGRFSSHLLLALQLHCGWVISGMRKWGEHSDISFCS